MDALIAETSAAPISLLEEAVGLPSAELACRTIETMRDQAA